MKNLPSKIYLQIGFQPEFEDDFKKLSGVTWSVDRVGNSDIEYFLDASLLSNDEAGMKWVSVIEWLKNEIADNENAKTAGYGINTRGVETETFKKVLNKILDQSPSQPKEQPLTPAPMSQSDVEKLAEDAFELYCKDDSDEVRGMYIGTIEMKKIRKEDFIEKWKLGYKASQPLPAATKTVEVDWDELLPKYREWLKNCKINGNDGIQCFTWIQMELRNRPEFQAGKGERVYGGGY